MPIYQNRSAPNGWGVDENGRMTKIPEGYVLQGNQYVINESMRPPKTVQQQQDAPQYQQPAPSIPQGYTQVGGASATDADLRKGSGEFEDYRFTGGTNGVWIAYKIPTATVIGPNGQRVTVRTDNKTGTYRTQDEMLSQGFQLESSPGVAQSGQTPGGGAVNLANRPPLVTANGDTIQPTDPNYTAYQGAGATPATGGTGGQAVRVGPTLFAQLRGQGLTEADIERRGVDIYIKPTSRFYQSAGGTPTTGGASAPAGGATPTQNSTTPTTDGSANIDPADRTWVNQLYQRYFDRDATSSELSNWARETPDALQQFLGQEAKRYGYTSAYYRDAGNQRLDTALNIIHTSGLPPEIQQLWEATVRAYPSGSEYNAQEVLNSFNQIKTTTIDPHFRELATIASNEFKTNLQNQNAQYEMNQETVRANAGQSIRQAKEGLEKSGMTFSGQGIEQLGAQSAYAQPNTQGGSAIPAQEPFGGMFYEGTVNQGNRLMASSASLANKKTMDVLNAGLEQNIGSAGAAAAGGTVKGGITGTLTTQQQGVYGQTLSGIMDNYRKKTALNTNITT